MLNLTLSFCLIAFSLLNLAKDLNPLANILYYITILICSINIFLIKSKN